MNLFIEQTLNGLQLGFTLLMVSAGLTLIFGIMNIINLAHGSLFMVGAFVAADVGGRTGNFLLALLAGIAGAAVAGLIVELGLIRRLYHRDHLYQVLATFALVLIANQAVQMIWGATPRSVSAPAFLDRTVTVLPGLPYPAYRLAITATGIAVIVFLHLLVERTRVGMWIRAGRTHRELLGAFGVNVRLLYTLVFGLGAMLAGLAGAMAGPVWSVEVGMGENILILTFVVIVIGGIGSVRGALVGSILVGFIDTMGRAFLPVSLGLFLDPATANGVGASLASMSIYIFMAAILVWKPSGLLPVHARS